MLKKIAVGVLTVLGAGILLIAPVALAVLAMARPPLAAAAALYETDATCSSAARAGLPQPTKPIPDSLRNGEPCAVSGAIVAEKDSLSGGSIGATHFVLGLRSDAGIGSVVTLDGNNAADLWNAIQPGDRVLVQTMRGQVTLVGDGTRTVRTQANPTAAAASNALGLWIALILCVLEGIAVGIIVALRRRSANPTEESQRDI
jgi:hypothetical protein